MSTSAATTASPSLSSNKEALDATYPDVTARTIAFGSCHKNKAASGDRGIIWDSISSLEPDAFLWTGDSIYAPTKGLASLEILRSEYQAMLTNTNTIANINTSSNTASTMTTSTAEKPNNENNKNKKNKKNYDKKIMNYDDSVIGYANFLKNNKLPGGVHGTWDDHDYGGNDYGSEMREREGRKHLFIDFIKASRLQAQTNETVIMPSVSASKTTTTTTTTQEDSINKHSKTSEYHREGVWNSVTYGTYPHKLKVIFLDTRSGRDLHCIPSVGTTRLPLGSPLACVTRWITAGLNLPRRGYCHNNNDDGGNGRVLQEEQWIWLEEELKNSDAQIHVIVSSIQVLTTNPVIESWGHFPEERERLLTLLNQKQNEDKGGNNTTTSHNQGVVLISGDVHYAEISEAKHSITSSTNGSTGVIDQEEEGRLLEVTSSGLTHSCEEPFYGGLCQPILDTFPLSRFSHQDSLFENENPLEANKNPMLVEQQQYFTSRNFGSIEIDWGDEAVTTDTTDTSTSNNSLDSSISSTSTTTTDTTTSTIVGRGKPTMMKINIHNHMGDIVLTTGSHPVSTYFHPHMSLEQIRQVPKCIDGHLLPYVEKGITIIMCILLVLLRFFVKKSVRKNYRKQSYNAPNKKNKVE